MQISKTTMHYNVSWQEKQDKKFKRIFAVARFKNRKSVVSVTSESVVRVDVVVCQYDI